MWGCCKQNDPIIPNVIGGGCVTIDKTDPENWVIKTTCPTEVISSDDSVDIDHSFDEDKNANIYDLSFACCDRLVAAWPNDDNPWVLYDKISVDSPLVKSLSGWWSQVEIALDIATLQTILWDELVKVNVNGNANYLQNLLNSWTWVDIDIINDNNMTWSIDQNLANRKRPCWKIRYGQTVEFNATHWTTGIWTFWDFTETISNDPAQLANPNAITFTKSGFYRVSVRWIIELNGSFHAFRVISISSNGSINWALDWKRGAGNSTNWIDLTSWDGKSMYDNNCITTVSATEVIQVNAWDTLTLWYRWSTEQTAYAIPGKGRIVWDNGSPYTSAISVWWFAVSWEYVDDIF